MFMKCKQKQNVHHDHKQKKKVVAKFKSDFTLWPYEWVKDLVGAFVKNNQDTCLIDATHLNAFISFSEISKYFTNCSTDIKQYASSYIAFELLP